MQRRSLLILAGAAAAGGGEAWAQAGLRPDPTPRLPPQPGQGLPVEDRRFLRDAEALSQAQAEAAGQAARQGGSEEVRRFAAAVAERRRALARQLAALAQQRGVEAAGHQPDPRVAEALRELAAAPAGTPAEADRGFLATELRIHPLLAEMYQAQASQTTDHELARAAIVALAGLQEDFATAARLGAPLGLEPPASTVANPPQYGPGATTTR